MTSRPEVKKEQMSKPIVLFLAANPKDTHRLALEDECNAILRELRHTPGGGEVEVRALHAATVHEVMRELNQAQPTLLHFSGHGSAEGIALEDNEGLALVVTPEALCQMLASAASAVTAVLLNSCYSQEQAEVLRDSIGCVVGMKGAIPDESARTFAVSFYRALGHGRSVHNAFEQACATLEGLRQRAEPRCLTRADVNADELYLRPAPPASAAAAPPAAAPAGVVNNHAGRDLIQNSLGTVQAGDHATFTFSTGGARK